MSEKSSNIGTLGEGLACKFLKSKKFEILDRNYRKTWGEVDIIAKKDTVLHFFEVKTISRERGQGIADFSPIENLTPKKVQRITRAIYSYLDEKRLDPASVWQVNGVLITLNMEKKIAEVELLENIGF